MLWTMAVVLMSIWLMGLVTGSTTGSFIHILHIAAVVLLVVSISQEVTIYRKPNHILRSRGPKPENGR